MPSPLILPGDPGHLTTPESREAPLVVCDGCGCLVSSALLSAHDRACGANR